MDSQARNPQTTSAQTQMTDPKAVQGTSNEAKLSGSETNEGPETNEAKLLSRSETKSDRASPQGVRAKPQDAGLFPP
eukprot:302099-Amorphochlora_amoeboformis.AAC.1